MKAVIFAAGEGKRLLPLTLQKPKPIVTVLDKPLIQHIWEVLPKEISEVILVVGYRGEMIREFISDNFLGKKVTYIQQEKFLGTAHALQICKEHLEKEEKFLLMYADDLHSKQGISKLLKFESALMVAPVDNPSRFGIVVLDENGLILDIEEKPEKPKSNLAATGVYVLTPKIFDYYDEAREGKGEYYLTEMIRSYLKDFKCSSILSDFWVPIGYPEDIERAEKILREL